MNYIYFTGKVYNIKSKKINDNNLSIFTIAQYYPFKGKHTSSYVRLRCELWNDKGANNINEGDLLAVIGKLKQNILEKNGNKVVQDVLVVYNYYKLDLPKEEKKEEVNDV